MTQKYNAHPDIIRALKQTSLNEFSIPQIRDILLATTMQHKSKSTLRLFVSRHLSALVEQGLLTRSGQHRKALFRKTALFLQISTEHQSNTGSHITEDKSEIKDIENKHLVELEKLQSRLNAELAMAIAEMDEYRSIMKLFPQTQAKVQKLFELSTQESAKLTGQVTAVTKTIELLQNEAA